MRISLKTLAASFACIIFCTSSLAQQDSPATQATPDTAGSSTIRAVIATVHHPRMKWPEFPYYKDEMEGLYHSIAFQPFWFMNGRPLPQIRDAVDILLEADARGLVPEDYDASELDEHVRQLQAGATFSPQDLAHFRNNGFEVLHGSTVLGKEATPEILSELEGGALRLRQKPGPANALGLAKFIFPNYGHDKMQEEALLAGEPYAP